MTSDAVPQHLDTETTEPEPIGPAPPPPPLRTVLRRRALRGLLVLLPVWAAVLVLLQALARAGR